MRICIELRRDVNPNVVLNLLYKHTQMQDTFGVIMLALVDNQPKVLNLQEMLGYYLDHQKDVVTRRTKYDLNKAEERAHILEGLLIALDNIDEVINIIRSSANTPEAKNRLIERFSLAQAIVDMRLRALTGLEREKIEAEYAELMDRIAELKAILADEKKLLGVIREEILLIAEKYGDERRTSIGFDEYDISMEDLIPVTNTVIAMTKLGYDFPSLHDVLYQYRPCIQNESLRNSGGKQNRERYCNHKPVAASAGREDYCCNSNQGIHGRTLSVYGNQEWYCEENTDHRLCECQKDRSCSNHIA